MTSGVKNSVFELHYSFFPAVWNWPRSLSIFIILGGEISEKKSIKGGLICDSCSIYDSSSTML